MTTRTLLRYPSTFAWLHRNFAALQTRCSTVVNSDRVDQSVAELWEHAYWLRRRQKRAWSQSNACIHATLAHPRTPSSPMWAVNVDAQPPGQAFLRRAATFIAMSV